MEDSVDRTVFKDKEVYVFYAVEIGILVLVAILLASRQWWSALLAPLLGLVGVITFGPPVRAEVRADKTIAFISPIRRNIITAKSLVVVKDAGAHDYAAHVILRNKGEFMVMYRSRKYEKAPKLAQAVLDLVDQTPNARVTDNARRLLEQAAKGNLSPLR